MVGDTSTSNTVHTFLATMLFHVLLARTRALHVVPRAGEREYGESFWVPTLLIIVAVSNIKISHPSSISSIQKNDEYYY